MTFIGYGKIDDEVDGPISGVLLETTNPVLSDAVCEAEWGEAWNAATTLCADASTDGVCSGDSGGPMLSNGVQFGIVSFVDTVPGVSAKMQRVCLHLSLHVVQFP